MPVITAQAASNLLKADAVRELGAKVVFNYEDLQRHMQERLAQSEAEAARLVAAAKAEAHAIREAARNEGREQGRREGLADATSQIETQARSAANVQVAQRVEKALPALEQVIRRLTEERDGWLARWENEAVRLTLAIAARLVRHEIASQPETATTMVREVLRMATGLPEIRVSLNPEDLAALGNEASTFAKAASGCGMVSIHPAPLQQRGGCLVETQFGAIDGRVETMLDRIAEELTGS